MLGPYGDDSESIVRFSYTAFLAPALTIHGSDFTYGCNVKYYFLVF